MTIAEATGIVGSVLVFITIIISAMMVVSKSSAKMATLTTEVKAMNGKVTHIDDNTTEAHKRLDNHLEGHD